MSVTYSIENLGRTKWTGKVVAQTDQVEHVEAALMRAARQHLMSRDIDFNGDVDAGQILVGGCRPVGTYRREP